MYASSVIRFFCNYFLVFSDLAYYFYFNYEFFFFSNINYVTFPTFYFVYYLKVIFVSCHHFIIINFIYEKNLDLQSCIILQIRSFVYISFYLQKLLKKKDKKIKWRTLPYKITKYNKITTSTTTTTSNWQNYEVYMLIIKLWNKKKKNFS